MYLYPQCSSLFGLLSYIWVPTGTAVSLVLCDLEFHPPPLQIVVYKHECNLNMMSKYGKIPVTLHISFDEGNHQLLLTLSVTYAMFRSSPWLSQRKALVIANFSLYLFVLFWNLYISSHLRIIKCWPFVSRYSLVIFAT